MKVDRVRTVATFTGSALCILSITAGLVLSYAARVLFRPESFADRVAASLAEPRVATLVATRLTDGLIKQRRELTAFRPIILSTSESLVSSSPFRAVVRRAAKVAHRTMISETGTQISLSVADAGVILQSALSTTPQLAKKIPARVTTILASSNDAPGGTIIVRLVRFARNLRIGAIALLIFGLLMGIVSFLIATERRKLLLRIGIALAIIALLLRLTVRFGGEAFALMVNDQLIGGALAGFWRAFLSGFMTWALVLGGIGLVLAAGVTSVFGGVKLLDISNSLRNWLSETHQRKSIRLVRAVVFLTIGMMALISPSFVITVVALVAALVVFFLGLQELFNVIVLAIPQREGSHVRAETRKRIPLGRTFVVSLIAVILAGAGIFYLLSSGKSAGIRSQIIDACNGYSELCDRPFNNVVIPATHNSMSAADIPTWMFAQQETSIPEQLRDGIRGFLIDAHYGIPAGDRVKTLLEDEGAARKKYESVLGKEGVDAAMRIRDRLVGVDEGNRGVYLCHGFCELGAAPFIPILQQIRDFLVMNPNEVITIVIQDEGVTPHDIEKCFQESGLIDFVYRGAVKPPWPTLRRMIASDQRVLVFAENNSAGVPWYHQAFESMQETPYTFHHPEEFSCRSNRGGSNAPLFLINHWIQTTPAPIPANAEKVNAYQFLLKRAQQCQRERQMRPNILAVDFYKSGDLFKVVETLNDLNSPKGSNLQASR
jgi:hypothetical protein